MKGRQDQNIFNFFIGILVVCISVVFCCASFAQDTLYLKNNIHFQMKLSRAGEEVCKASYANYTDPGAGHMFLSANTQVTTGIFKRGFSLIEQSSGREIFFEYNKKNMGGMAKEEYLDLIVSPEPVSLESFSDIDKQGIKEGKALVGMTKEGVKTALGYPAKHRTPSLEETTWIYWTNRFKTRAVSFDDAGKVTSIQ